MTLLGYWLLVLLGAIVSAIIAYYLKKNGGCAVWAVVLVAIAMTLLWMFILIWYASFYSPAV
jgi:hypothetical protein